MSASDILASAFPILLALVMGVLGTLRGFWREAIVSASIVLGALIVQQWGPLWSNDVYGVFTGMSRDMLEVVLSGVLLVLTVLVLGYGLGAVIRRDPLTGGSRTGGFLLGVANGAALGGWILRYIYMGLDGSQASSPLYQNAITQGFMIWAGWFPVALAAVGALAALIAPFRRPRVEVTQTAPHTTVATPVAPPAWNPAPPVTSTTSTTTSTYGAPTYGAQPYGSPPYGATPYAPAPAPTPYAPPAPTPYSAPPSYAPAPTPAPYAPPPSPAAGRMSGPVGASTPYDPTMAYPTQYGPTPSMPTTGPSLAPAGAVYRSAELRPSVAPEPTPEPTDKPYDPDTAGVATIGLSSSSPADATPASTSLLADTTTGTGSGSSVSDTGLRSNEPASADTSDDSQRTPVFTPGDTGDTGGSDQDTLPDALQRSPDWLGTPTTSHNVVSTESSAPPPEATADTVATTTSASTTIETENREPAASIGDADLGSTREMPVAAMSGTPELAAGQEHRCPNCGSDVLPNALFCTECGTRLRQA